MHGSSNNKKRQRSLPNLKRKHDSRFEHLRGTSTPIQGRARCLAESESEIEPKRIKLNTNKKRYKKLCIPIRNVRRRYINRNHDDTDKMIRRIIDSLKSGLVSQVSWALGILNTLLSDESKRANCRLKRFPKLLTLLLDHMDNTVSEMFEPLTEPPFRFMNRRKGIQYSINITQNCTCLSIILRNLTLMYGNENLLAGNNRYLCLISRFLQLHHEHPSQNKTPDNSERWLECLCLVCFRENALVSIANLAGYVDVLKIHPESIARRILDALLHWVICPAELAQNSLKTVKSCSRSSHSPNRLALEALHKLCITESNIHFILSTPPYCRFETVTDVITKMIQKTEKEEVQELAIKLMLQLVCVDSRMSYMMSLKNECATSLIEYIEQTIKALTRIGPLCPQEQRCKKGHSKRTICIATQILLHFVKYPEVRSILKNFKKQLLFFLLNPVTDEETVTVVSQIMSQLFKH